MRPRKIVSNCSILPCFVCGGWDIAGRFWELLGREWTPDEAVWRRMGRGPGGGRPQGTPLRAGGWQGRYGCAWGDDSTCVRRGQCLNCDSCDGDDWDDEIDACFQSHIGAPSRGWIPAFAGKTKVGKWDDWDDEIDACFQSHIGAPSRGWIPAFAGKTKVGKWDDWDDEIDACFQSHIGAPSRGWIPAFAGKTKVGKWSDWDDVKREARRGFGWLRGGGLGVASR